MKGTLLPLLVISTSLCVSMAGMAQDVRSLQQNVESSVKAKRPDWPLSSKKEKDKQIVYRWGSRNDGARLLVFFGNSQTEAAARMETSLNMLSGGPGKKRTDIADEAYIVTRSDYAIIRFRKGKVYFELVASATMAEDLAKSLAELPSK